MKRRALFCLPLLLLIVLIFPLRAKADSESGQCGENVYWKISDDGSVMTIYGTGDMYDKSYYEANFSNADAWYSMGITPEHYISPSIIIIENGVTSIRDYAFRRFELTSVYIPASVSKIGEDAFIDSSYPPTIRKTLPTLYYTGPVNTWKLELPYELASHVVFLSEVPNGWFSISVQTEYFSDPMGDYVCSSPLWFYYQNGQPYTGWAERNGKQSYVVNGQALRNTLLVDSSSGTEKYFFLNGEGTVVTTAGWYYGNATQYDGSSIQTDDSFHWYYVDSDASPATGWKMKNGKWYYILSTFDLAKGRSLEIDGKVYLFSEDGAWINTPGLFLVDGYYVTAYYINDDGTLYAGLKNVNGKEYYFNPLYIDCPCQAVNCMEVTVNGEAYLFGYDAARITTPGVYTLGSLNYSPEIWCVDDNGKLYTGWKRIDGSWYYFGNFATDGHIYNHKAVVNQFYAVDGHLYYFDINGKMVTGKQTITVADGTSKEFTFDATGACMLSPGWQDPINEAYAEYFYYVNTDGTLKSGWLWDNGNYYYLSPADYHPYTNTIYMIDGHYYGFTFEGKMCSNRSYSKYEWDSAKGEYCYYYYYLGSDGAAITGWKQFDDDWVYYESDSSLDSYCQMLIESWKKIDGMWYYFASDGAMSTDWKRIDGSWYYFGSDGAMRTGWKQISGSWYYFGSDGAMKTGWQNIGGSWYYLNNTMATGWKQISGSWYYFGSDGAMKTGWKQISGSWYYLGSDGAMKTGWKQIGSTWYYLGSDGAMRTGWQQISGSWYYLGSDGAMKTGWQNIGGTWYYLNNTMATGWKQIGDTWYYFKANGAMACSETLSIGGTSYSFAASGAWES